MEYVRFAVRFTTLMLVLVAAGTYAYLIYSGEVPKPDIEAIMRQIVPTLSAGGSVLAVAAMIGLALCVFLAAIAPLVFALRSGDFFTVLVSVVALILCAVLLTYSRTVIDMVLAAIVYFTSAFISVIVYSTERIATSIVSDRR